MSNSKMLVTAPSCTRNAVVFGLGKAHNRGGTSTVYCLELVQDHANKGKVHVQGRPFRLYDNKWLYIWDNDFIRDQDIQEGSIVSFQGLRFVGNTGETMVSAVKKYHSYIARSLLAFIVRPRTFHERNFEIIEERLSIAYLFTI